MESHWTLVGAGAIGGLFACQLSRAGIAVQLANYGENHNAHHRELLLLDGDSRETFRLPLLHNDASIERLILTTKTYQSRDAISAIQQQIMPDATLIVLQNGMGTAEWLRELFPRAKVLAATTTHGAYREGRNTIIHAGHGDTWLGPLDPDDLPLADTLCQQWQHCGVPVILDAGIHKRLWLKLGINCVINPLTVIHDCRNGELLNNPEALATMEAIASEFTRVYEAVFGESPPQDLFKLAKDVAERTGANISSMRQDVLSGRPTEIDAINGYLVRQARLMNLHCPANEGVIGKLRAGM